MAAEIGRGGGGATLKATLPLVVVGRRGAEGGHSDKMSGTAVFFFLPFRGGLWDAAAESVTV